MSSANVLGDVLREPEAVVYPHFDTVPVDSVDENIDYRKFVLSRCEGSVTARAGMLKKCSEDSLFWLSTFCWLFEPRPFPRVIPFIPWTHQVPVWGELERWLGYSDTLLEKSRGEGASWMILMLCLYKWLNVEMFAAGFVSKDERSVDDPENPDSLFWKLQFQLDKLPDWMIAPGDVDRSLKNHTFLNLKNRATLTGFAATGDVASGGRKTVFVLDEMAKFPYQPAYDALNSTQYVTDSRCFISTPKGPNGAFFDVAHKKKTGLKKLTLDWRMNPERTVGSYRVHIALDDSRRVELIDEEYWQKRMLERGYDCDTEGELLRAVDKIRPDAENEFGYEFWMTGPYVKHDELRSPWYDVQCDRSNSPSDVAQELDRDYGGSASRFFDANVLIRLQESSTPPFSSGEMKIPRRAEARTELTQCRYKESHGGRLNLWFKPDFLERVPQHRNYVIGSDISAGGSGVQTSNSTLEVIDRLTGRHVAELASPQLSPEELAIYAVALCYWFSGPMGPALLIWEANGPNGAQFGQKIVALGYQNIYYRGQTEEYIERESRKMGFWTNLKTKPAMLGALRDAMDSGRIDVCSWHCLEEMKYYFNMPGGKIEHIAQSSEKDPSGAGERHGDRVIGLGLAWWVVKDYISDSSSSEPTLLETPPNCVLGRRKQVAEDRDERQAWVPPSGRRGNFRR